MPPRSLRLLALFVFSFVASAPVWAENGQFKESFSRSSPFNANGRVSLENVNGDITIETWDKQEILVTGEKNARTDEELKMIQLTIDLSPSRAEIKVHLPKRKSGWFNNNSIRAGVRFKLMVPATVALERINTVNSSVQITGVTGPVSAESVNGRVQARDLGSDARLRTVNGQVVASFTAIARGQELSFKTVNGSIHVALPANAGFELQTSVVNGDIDCDFPLEIEGRISRKRLSGKVGDGRASLSADSVNGSIHLEKR